jgi:hypothetical protein
VSERIVKYREPQKQEIESTNEPRCADGHDHCWHWTNRLNAMMHPETQESCCWCGAQKLTREVHGPHHPDGTRGYATYLTGTAR